MYTHKRRTPSINSTNNPGKTKLLPDMQRRWSTTFLFARPLVLLCGILECCNQTLIIGEILVIIPYNCWKFNVFAISSNSYALCVTEWCGVPH